MRTNHITVRDRDYEVRELSGADMIGVRKLLSNEIDKNQLEAFVAWKCCINPKFETQVEAASLPFSVLAAISTEAFRLGTDEQKK